MKIVRVGRQVFVTSSQLAGIQRFIAETPEKSALVFSLPSPGSEKAQVDYILMLKKF